LAGISQSEFGAFQGYVQASGLWFSRSDNPIRTFHSV